jgi:hypothetical protein
MVSYNFDPWQNYLKIFFSDENNPTWRDTPETFLGPKVKQPLEWIKVTETNAQQYGPT